MNLMNRPPPGQKPPKPVNGTAKGRAHMGRVKGLPCRCCGRSPPSEAHHCRSDGMARDDFKTIPLCKLHHTGAEGYHTRKKTWEAKYGKDYWYLPTVERLLDESVEIDF